jgi:nucleotide-binding universal stress UspA family protein
MLHTDRILVATDFSDTAERARRQAEHLAVVHDAALHVLHVTADRELVELFENLPEDEGTPRRAQAYLAEWLGQPIEPPSAARSAPVRTGEDPEQGVPDETWTVRYGTAPAEVILDSADEIEADLLVLGAETQARLLGGVTDTVVGRARRPVITVPGPQDKPSEQPRVPRDLPRHTLRRLLVAVDGPEPPELLLGHARVLAAQSGASVDLVRARRPSFARTLAMGWSRAGRTSGDAAQAEREVNDLAERLRGVGIPTRSRTLRGDPASAITKYADERRMDLILLEARVRTGVSRMVLGNVAEGVIRTAPCPVATFKRDGHSLLSGEGPHALNWHRRRHLRNRSSRTESS